MRLIGHPFTWEKGRGTDKWIEEKLDRIMVTKLWLDLFSSARAWNLQASYSDHSPLFLDFCTPTGYTNTRASCLKTSSYEKLITKK